MKTVQQRVHLTFSENLSETGEEGISAEQTSSACACGQVRGSLPLTPGA